MIVCAGIVLGIILFVMDIYKVITHMAQWFDFSNNSNKFRQTYVQGFVDISGGGIYLRNDNSIQVI